MRDVALFVARDEEGLSYAGLAGTFEHVYFTFFSLSWFFRCSLASTFLSKTVMFTFAEEAGTSRERGGGLVCASAKRTISSLACTLAKVRTSRGFFFGMCFHRKHPC